MRLVILLIVAVLLSGTAIAQLHVIPALNIERQPIWGPTGYDHVEYYFLPDIDVYYNVPHNRFYYNEGGSWISSAALPSPYRGYDLYLAHKVVINEPTPYRHNRMYRERYASFKGRQDQQPIRDSHETRYFANVNHPRHKAWLQQNARKDERGNNNGREVDRNQSPKK